jgi:hypothetical protein
MRHSREYLGRCIARFAAALSSSSASLLSGGFHSLVDTGSESLPLLDCGQSTAGGSQSPIRLSGRAECGPSPGLRMPLEATDRAEVVRIAARERKEGAPAPQRAPPSPTGFLG